MQEPQTPPTNGMPPAGGYDTVYAGAQDPAQSSYTPSGYPPPGYTGQPGGYNQPPYPGQPAPAQGLSDTAAGAIAYITILPAIVFLLLAPYNTRPFVKFHAIQCLGLAVTGFCVGILSIVPILGLIVALVGYLGLAVIWILSLIKASQGSYLKLPVISDFAAQQSGYAIRSQM